MDALHKHVGTKSCHAFSTWRRARAAREGGGACDAECASLSLFRRPASKPSIRSPVRAGHTHSGVLSEVHKSRSLVPVLCLFSHEPQCGGRGEQEGCSSRGGAAGATKVLLRGTRAGDINAVTATHLLIMRALNQCQCTPVRQSSRLGSGPAAEAK
jgi:hypothetical protein